MPLSLRSTTHQKMYPLWGRRTPLIPQIGKRGAVEKVQIHDQGCHGQTCLAVLRHENQALPHRPAIAMRFFNSPNVPNIPQGEVVVLLFTWTDEAGLFGRVIDDICVALQPRRFSHQDQW